MQQTKKWYQSSTIWSIVFSAIAFIATRFIGVQPEDINVPASPDFEQLKAIAEQVKEAHGNIGQLAAIVLGSVGAIIAIYNRIVAKAKLK